MLLFAQQNHTAVSYYCVCSKSMLMAVTLLVKGKDTVGTRLFAVKVVNSPVMGVVTREEAKKKEER